MTLSGVKQSFPYWLTPVFPARRSNDVRRRFRKDREDSHVNPIEARMRARTDSRDEGPGYVISS
jgi:hypothetical protein